MVLGVVTQELWVGLFHVGCFSLKVREMKVQLGQMEVQSRSSSTSLVVVDFGTFFFFTFFQSVSLSVWRLYLSNRMILRNKMCVTFVKLLSSVSILYSKHSFNQIISMLHCFCQSLHLLGGFFPPPSPTVLPASIAQLCICRGEHQCASRALHTAEQNEYSYNVRLVSSWVFCSPLSEARTLVSSVAMLRNSHHKTESHLHLASIASH